MRGISLLLLCVAPPAVRPAPFSGGSLAVFRVGAAPGGGLASRPGFIDEVAADTGALLQTSVSGALEPLTAASARRALWRHPAMTLGVIARIHWQAARLWIKRVRFVRKPAPPELFVTR
jgi:hypothetical protein